MRALSRKATASAIVAALSILVAGCSERTTAAKNVTATTANLHATVQCTPADTKGGAGCYYQFRWRRAVDGAWSDGPLVGPTAASPTPVDVSQAVSNLSPQTVYVVEVCGLPDQIRAPSTRALSCAGSDGKPSSSGGSALTWFVTSAFGSSLPTRLRESTGASLYVSNRGSDSTGNGTASAPWATLHDAVNRARPGNTIVVASGVYAAPQITSAGTASAPITIAAARGATVATLGRWTLWGADYWRIRNISANGTNSADHAFFAFNGAHDDEWDGGALHDSPRSNVLIDESASRIWIRGARIYRSGRRQERTHNLDHGLYVSGTDNVIENDLVYDNDANGMQLYPNAQHSYAVNNTFDHNGRSGVLVGGNTSETSNSNLIANNISTNNGFQTAGYNSAQGYLDYWDGHVGSGNLAYDNLAWGNETAAFRATGGLVVSNLIQADPLFSNEPGRVFTLRSGTPAIGLGVESLMSPDDITGATRHFPALGAYG